MCQSQQWPNPSKICVAPLFDFDAPPVSAAGIGVKGKYFNTCFAYRTGVTVLSFDVNSSSRHRIGNIIRASTQISKGFAGHACTANSCDKAIVSVMRLGHRSVNGIMHVLSSGLHTKSPQQPAVAQVWPKSEQFWQVSWKQMLGSQQSRSVAHGPVGEQGKENDIWD